jgi:type II secretory pathway component PulJ
VGGVDEIQERPALEHTENGQALELETRSSAEQVFGTDLSAVRVHTGPAARDAADALNARAYTVGNHVVVGEVRPGLLAHELAHVVQQQRGGTQPPGAMSEKAAHRVAHSAVRGDSGVDVGAGTALGIARAGKEDDDPDGDSEQDAEPVVTPAASKPKRVGVYYGGTTDEGRSVRKGIRKPKMPTDVTTVRRPGGFPGFGAAPLTEQEQQFVSETDVAQARLGRPLILKTKAAAPQGMVVRSGFGKANAGAASTAKVLALGAQIGHSFAVNSSIDEGIPGQEKASHAEKLAVVENSGQPLAVDRAMCPDCVKFFQSLAKARGSFLVVQEPGLTWVFRPDGIRVGQSPTTQVVLYPDGRASAGPRPAAITTSKPPDSSTEGGKPGPVTPSSTGPALSGTTATALPRKARADRAGEVDKTVESDGNDKKTPAAAAPAVGLSADQQQISSTPRVPRQPPTDRQLLRRRIAGDLDTARAESKTVSAALRNLEDRARDSELTAAETARQSVLTGQQAALDKRIGRADADLRLLDEPGARATALAELRARRGPTTDTAAVTETESTGARLSEKGLVSRDQTQTSQVVQGTAKTITDTRSSTLTPTSFTQERGLSSKVVAGATSTATSVDTSRGVNAAAGDLAVSSSRTTKRVETDEASGITASSTQRRQVSAGTGGISQTTERSEQVDNTLAKTSTTRGVTRGGGAIGAGSATTKTVGEVDAEGNLVKGTATTTSGGINVIAGPGQAGVGGKLGVESKQARGNGVTTGQSVTLDGKVLVTCQEVEGSSPPTYRVGLSINLGGGLTVSTNAEKKSVEANPAAATGGIAISASGSLSGSFTHLMSEQQTVAYLNAVRSHTNDGAHRELAVIALAAKGAIEQARLLLNEIRSVTGSAASAKNLQEGETVVLNASGSTGVTGNLGASRRGGSSVGIKLGYTRGGSIGRTVSRENGKIVVKVDVLSESTGSAGVTGGFGVASAGLSGTAGTLAGQSVTFALDPSEARFDTIFASIEATDDIQKLRQLSEANKNLVTSSTVTIGKSGSTTSSAGVAGAGIEFEDASSLTESRTVDKKGTTVQVTGTSSVGGKVSLPVGPAVTTKSTDTFTGKVGTDNKATGDASTTTSESDFGRSAVALGTGLTEHPLATVSGLVTGSDPVVKQRTESAGTKLDDGDYARLVALARSPRDWQAAFRSRVNDGGYVGWEQTRRKIVASGGDRETVIRALAEFEAGGSGRTITIRTAAAASGAGIRYDFPDVLADQKATYDELVVGDPIAPAHALAIEGKTKDATDRLTADADRLRKLQNAIQMKQNEVSDPGVLGEMLRRIGVRGTQIRAELRSIRRPPAAPATNAKDPTAAGQNPDPTVAAAHEKAERVEERNEKIRTLVPACITFREREKAIFVEIDEEYSHWYRKADYILVINRLNALRAMYKEWDEQVDELRAVYVERGDPASRVEQFMPNKAGFDVRYRRWKTI